MLILQTYKDSSYPLTPKYIIIVKSIGFSLGGRLGILPKLANTGRLA